MVNAVGSTQNQAAAFMKNRRLQSVSSDSVWNKILNQADACPDEATEEKKICFARRDTEQEEKEMLVSSADETAPQEEMDVKKLFMNRAGVSSNVPYGYLAKDGIIEYEGVVFVCDEQRNAICLGDMTNPDEVINIPLSEGGCLKVNRENLGELSKAISMFSPEDIRRIMEAIATDTKCQQMQQEMDETINSIAGISTMVSDNNKADIVTAEQIAELFRDREE